MLKRFVGVTVGDEIPAVRSDVGLIAAGAGVQDDHLG